MNRHSTLAVAAGAAGILLLLQLTPLFWGGPFYVDWVNHVWLVEYCATHLTQHGTFPTTIDVAQGFGHPLPVFYGVFFYPLLSLVSLAVGADVAVRLLCGVLLIVPVISCGVLLRRWVDDTPLAILLSTVINASVYQLTNLYARSALTEFVAGQLLILAISLLFYGITRLSRGANAALAFGSACVALSLGAHPITFYTCSLFVGPLVLIGAVSLKRVIVPAQAWRLFGWAACVIVVLLPWVINTVMLRGDLQVSTTNVLAGKLYYFPNSIDSLWGKLGLFYVDPRVLSDGIDATSTPFLDAPLPLGLLLVVIVVFVQGLSRDRRAWYGLVVPSVVCACAMVYMMLPPYAAVPPGGALPGYWPDTVSVSADRGWVYQVLLPIQFVYRLSGTFSLCLTVALVAGLALLRETLSPRPVTRVLTVAASIGVVVALIGAGQRLYVTYAEFVAYPAHRLQVLASSKAPKDSDRVLLMRGHEYDEMIRNVTKYPSTFYSARDYTMPRLFPPRSTARNDRQVVSWVAEHYDHPSLVVCDQPCIVHTNIVPSTLHRVVVDGRERRDLGLARDGNIEFSVGSGSHSLTVEHAGQVVPYISASVWVMLMWLGGSVLWCIWVVGPSMLGPWLRLVRR